MIEKLPAINASLNFLAFLFLVAGRRSILRQDRTAHVRWMVGALVISSVFLACYLYYHFNIGAVTKYQGEGLLRYTYFFILITHIPLAAALLPCVFFVFYLAISKNFERHKKWARVVWPVWIYVSVTGVLIYLMLYVFPQNLG